MQLRLWDYPDEKRPDMAFNTLYGRILENRSWPTLE